MKVDEIMTSPVVTVPIGASFKHVVTTMLDAGVSGLPVVDAGGAVVGVVTEADLLPREALGGRRRRPLAALADVIAGGETQWEQRSKASSAGELMTSRPVTARPDEDVRVVARRMLMHRVKRMPVVDDGGRLVGIVTRSDILAIFGRSDTDLAAAADGVLRDPRFAGRGDGVTAAVDDGVVTLRGRVRDGSDGEAVVAAVRAVPGVVDVIDRLEVDHDRSS